MFDVQWFFMSFPIEKTKKKQRRATGSSGALSTSWMRPTWGCRRSGKGPGGEEINANQWKTHGICMGYMYINVYIADLSIVDRVDRVATLDCR